MGTWEKTQQIGKRVSKRVGGAFALDTRHEVLLQKKVIINNTQCRERAGRMRAGKRPLDLAIYLIDCRGS